MGARIAGIAESGYAGPGWQEWLLSFAATMLIAATMLGSPDDGGLRSAWHYYLHESWVLPLHGAAIAVNVVTLGLILTWIVRGKPMRWLQRALVWVAALGVGLVWFELVRALDPVADRVYHLHGLPLSPINNAGLIGSTLYGSYLILRLPLRGFSVGAQVGLRVGLLVCAMAAQWVLWDLLARGAR